MRTFTRISLLLLFTFPVYAAPPIHCEPASVFDVLKSELTLTIMTLAFFLTALWTLYNERGDLSWIAWLTISFILGGVLFFNAPKSLPVVDEETIMSRPDIANGRHYRNECVLVYSAETTVTLNCKPDGRAITIPKTDYDSTVRAFNLAQIQLREMKRRLPNNNICSPE